jgi:hypothetical protein
VNWLEFIAAVVGAIAWPTVFVVVFFALRKPIRDLLPFLQRLKYKEVELEFNRRVEEIGAEVVQEVPVLPQIATPNADELADVAKLAETSPRAAVLEAWLSVETAALGAARRLGWFPPSEKATNGLAVMKYLERHEEVDRSIVGLIRELRSLRNQAAHTPEFVLSKAAAIDYGSSATRVAKYLRSVRPNA